MYCWSVVCRNETWDVCVQLWRISPISGSWKIIFRRVSERDLTFSGLLVFIWNPASHQVQRSGLTLRFAPVLVFGFRLFIVWRVFESNEQIVFHVNIVLVCVCVLEWSRETVPLV